MNLHWMRTVFDDSTLNWSNPTSKSEERSWPRIHTWYIECQIDKNDHESNHRQSHVWNISFVCSLRMKCRIRAALVSSTRLERRLLGESERNGPSTFMPFQRSRLAAYHSQILFGKRQIMNISSQSLNIDRLLRHTICLFPFSWSSVSDAWISD
jgi:hypothetical protein